jgi:hypothetical protein
VRMKGDEKHARLEELEEREEMCDKFIRDFEVMLTKMRKERRKLQSQIADLRGVQTDDESFDDE